MREDLTGKIFHRLTVVSFSELRGKHLYWKCLCICGNESFVSSSNLKRSEVKSCGCLRHELHIARVTTHNQSGLTTKTKEYRSWADMKTRCYNTKSESYKNYGGRGITVCDRWLNSFEYFLSDVGVAPSRKHTMDRINVNGNYEPSNCRWADGITQGINKRNNRLLSLNGETKALSQWCRDLNLVYDRVLQRKIKLGWSDEDALLTP
jgi:hypothetical protein